MPKILLPLVAAAIVLIAPALSYAQELSAAERRILQKVERYLNDVTTLEAEFVQISSDGSAAEGKFYLDRPGKLRFDYAPPTPILLVSTGHDTIYYDKETKNATYFDPDDSPVGLFLAEKVSFDGSIKATEVTERAQAVRVTLVQAEDPLAGSLELVFTDGPFQLRQWTIKDAQGIETTVTLFETKVDHELDQELFTFVRPRRFQRREK